MPASLDREKRWIIHGKGNRCLRRFLRHQLPSPSQSGRAFKRGGLGKAATGLTVVTLRELRDYDHRKSMPCRAALPLRRRSCPQRPGCGAGSLVAKGPACLSGTAGVLPRPGACGVDRGEKL